jgi:hypothetical protein
VLLGSLEARAHGQLISLSREVEARASQSTFQLEGADEEEEGALAVDRPRGAGATV